MDGLVCDLDGVLYRGRRRIAGAAETLARLEARGVRIVYATNNSRATVERYVETLAGFGVRATADQVLTSAVVTADVLRARGAAGRRALVIGGDGIRVALQTVGMEVVDDRESGADVVVVGWDPRFDYDAMKHASMTVRAGAEFIATNADASFPAADGLWPGAGAIVASIEVASGRRAEVMGKPHAPMMDAAAARLRGARHVVAIGDRPDTDLAGAARMGWTTVLVLSGVTPPERAGEIDPAPDLVLDSLSDLCPEAGCGQRPHS